MSFINKMRSQKGFTLIELLITVVILAILAAVVYSTLAPNKDTAKASRAVAAAQDVYAQAQSYATNNGNYEDFSQADLTGQLSDSTTAVDANTKAGENTIPNAAYILVYTPSGEATDSGIIICTNATKVAAYCIKDDAASTKYMRIDKAGNPEISSKIGTAANNYTPSGSDVQTWADKWVN